MLALFFSSLPPLHAQTASGPTASSTRQQSIEELLTDSLSASAQLRQALIAQRALRIDLEIAYAALKERLKLSSSELQREISNLQSQLQNSTTLSDSLLAEISRLTALLIELKTDSVALSREFENYRAEMQRQVRSLERERDFWRAGAVGAAVIAAALGIWAAVK